MAMLPNFWKQERIKLGGSIVKRTCGMTGSMRQLRIFSTVGPEVTAEEQKRVTVVQTFCQGQVGIICSTVEGELSNGAVAEGNVRSYESGKEKVIS